MDCRNRREARYLVAVINSYTLAEALKPLMPKGQFGPCHLQRHLWNLPIPEYDDENPLHRDLARLGRYAERHARRTLELVRLKRGWKLSGPVARRELRAWLRNSLLGETIEIMVNALLAENGGPDRGLPWPELPCDFAEIRVDDKALKQEWKRAIKQPGSAHRNGP